MGKVRTPKDGLAWDEGHLSCCKRKNEAERGPGGVWGARFVLSSSYIFTHCNSSNPRL